MTDSDLDKHDHDHDRKQHDHKNEPGRAVAALFASVAEGREALKSLQKAHVGKLWFGTTSIAETSAGDPAVTVETGGFFSKTESFVDALVRHGVDGDDARRLDGEIDTGNSVVTVEPKDDKLSEAMEIVAKHGGRTASDTSTLLAPSSLLVGASALDLDELNEDVFYRR